MAKKWTPWFKAPMGNRLETLSIAFMIFCFLPFGLLSICVTIMFYILYAGNIYLHAICLAYIAFWYYDWNAGDRGGRGAGMNWIRGLSAWKYCINYFPVDLIKTGDLPANRNYLVCFFPHGVLSFGAFLTFNSNHSKWSTYFPGVRSKISTLAMNLQFPIVREALLSVGVCSASKNSLTTLMTQSNDPADESNRDGYTSNAVGLIVGGAEESFHTHENSYKCVLKNRKGFVKIALRTGASLVPAVSFGENDVYEVVKYQPGSWGWFIQHTIKQYTRVAPLIFNGRGYFQYNFGLMPKRHPINLVIGAPIHLEKTPNPSNDQIDRIHKRFCTELDQLFERHKSKYVENPDEVHLEII